MRHISRLLWGLLFILSMASTDGFARAGRRVCATAPQSRSVAYTESHVQPVYQPYLTTCQGHRLCSTYRTLYRVAYRQAYRQVAQPVAPCCPGWSRANSHALGCDRALCWVPCQNGGTCAFPGRCACPPGWMGRACQTDVDECASQGHGCGQLCINTAGSYHCACWDGFSLAADDKVCQPLVPAPEPETFSQAVTKESLYHPNYLPSHKYSHCSICKGDRAHPQHAVTEMQLFSPSSSSSHRASLEPRRAAGTAGPPSEMKEEMNELKSRVEALEQKLQLVLAPFHNLMPSAPEDVGADPISRLSHSLQQLDRIDSLSEQISFLEERLETCSCKNEL